MQIENLRITFIVGSLGLGGAERQLYYVISMLKKNKSKIQVLCLQEGEYWEKKIKDLGVSVIWVGSYKNKLMRLITIYRHTKKFKSNIIQSFHFFTNLYSFFTAKLLFINDIGAIRNDVYSEVKSNGKLLGNLSLYLPNLIIANSMPAINNAIKLGVNKERLVLLPNVIDSKRFQNNTEYRKRSISFLTIGRFEKQKRYDKLIKIFDKLNSYNLNFFAKLIGDGSEKKNIQLLIEKLGLEHIVSIEPATPNVLEFYKKADIFLLVSDHEGSPNVILEAMSAGLIIVTTNVGSLNHIIKHNINGFIFDIEDKEKMVDFLKFFIKNKKLSSKIKLNAMNTIEKKYDIKHLTNYLNTIYQNI